jgi:hypothetical protein
MWVRTNRRAPGANPDDFNAERVPGPWHQMVADSAGHLSWCGRKPLRMFPSTQHTFEEPPADQRRCGDCEKAKAEGRPRAFRRRR